MRLRLIAFQFQHTETWHGIDNDIEDEGTRSSTRMWDGIVGRDLRDNMSQELNQSMMWFSAKTRSEEDFSTSSRKTMRFVKSIMNLGGELKYFYEGHVSLCCICARKVIGDHSAYILGFDDHRHTYTLTMHPAAKKKTVQTLLRKKNSDALLSTSSQEHVNWEVKQLRKVGYQRIDELLVGTRNRRRPVANSRPDARSHLPKDE
ncbi:hypothetical protein EDD85DRAFT_989653 [Armillaria nabsnona]|nr:hypothetical protein EDD85DRAFT_989653 [Armillaria nabsnona]